MVVFVGPRTGQFNIVSNDHGRTLKCNFSILDQKYHFGQIRFRKSKLSVKVEI